jgi:prepilin-type N-terminal cleavage/methylation domain-containing protein
LHLQQYFYLFFTDTLPAQQGNRCATERLTVARNLLNNRPLKDEVIMKRPKKKGFSLVELLTVVTIAVIVISAGYGMFGPSARRGDLLNHLRYLKATFVQARANAIENAAPVRYTYDRVAARILAVRDQDRDGDFSDSPVVVIGTSDSVGTLTPYTKNVEFDASHSGVDLPHWFQGTGFSGVNMDFFTDDQFVITPSGRLFDPDTLNPASGTYFFKTTDNLFYGAVHMTTMGEVKMAYRRDGATSGDYNGWIWME